MILAAILGMAVGLAVGALLAIPLSRSRDRMQIAALTEHMRSIAAAIRDASSVGRELNDTMRAAVEQCDASRQQLARVAERLERR